LTYRALNFFYRVHGLSISPQAARYNCLGREEGTRPPHAPGLRYTSGVFPGTAAGGTGRLMSQASRGG
jgi:hypothetical protein